MSENRDDIPQEMPNDDSDSILDVPRSDPRYQAILEHFRKDVIACSISGTDKIVQ